MDDTTGNTPAGSGLFPAGGSVFERIRLLARSGILFYWSSFFALILFEFYIGGQLSVILTKENYSVYINVLNTLPFYNVLTNIGISYSIVYIISYNRPLGYGLFRQALSLQFAWYALMVLVHVAVFSFFRNTYFNTLLITVIISYTYAYRLNITSYFLATRAYNKAAVANMLQKLSLLIILTVAVHLTTGAGNVPSLGNQLNGHFFIAYPALEFLVVLLYFVVFPKTNYRAVTAPKQNYRKRLLKYGKYAMLNNGLNVLYYTIMAAAIRSSRLEVHQQIILGLCIIFFRYTAVAIAPVFSTMNPQMTLIKNDGAKVQDLYKKYLLITALLSLSMVLAGRFLFGYFIDHFYDASYHDLPGYFNFFSYLVPLLFFSSLNGSVLASLGKIKYTTVVEMVCTAVLLLFLIYNTVSPIAGYRVFFYVIVFHLSIKFVMLNFGAYKTIKIR